MKKCMRIVQVVNVRWFNATAWYALFLSRLLQDAGHEVLVLTLPGSNSEKQAQKWGLKTQSLPLNTQNPLQVIHLYRELKKLVHSFAPDIVNCHRGENFFLWAMLRKSFPFALVRTRGDQRAPKKNSINKILHRKLCDLIIATSSTIAAQCIEAFHCSEMQIETILGGVDTSVFQFEALGRSRVRAEFAFEDSDFVLGFLGRFDPVKGVSELITAFGDYNKKRKERGETQTAVKLFLVAFPENYSLELVESWLEKEGIRDISIITGKRSDVGACISAMDGGIIASQGSETIARAAFEIMSCGVPLISTNVGVMPDLLPYWALMPTGDSAAMSEKISCLVEDVAFRSNLRDACLSCVVGMSETDFLRQTVGAYGKAIQARVARIHKNTKNR